MPNEAQSRKGCGFGLFTLLVYFVWFGSVRFGSVWFPLVLPIPIYVCVFRVKEYKEGQLTQMKYTQRILFKMLPYMRNKHTHTLEPKVQRTRRKSQNVFWAFSMLLKSFANRRNACNISNNKNNIKLNQNRNKK